MVRFPLCTAHQAFPAKIFTCDSNFLSKKHQCLYLLKLCSSSTQVSQIHAQILVSGLHHESFLQNELIRVAALSSSRNLCYAWSLLQNYENLTPLPWNLIIRGYVSGNSPGEAFSVFRQMRDRGIRPNKLTFPFVLKACAMLAAIREGRQVHAEVLKCGLDSDVYVQNTMVSFYGSCRGVSDARRVFDVMLDRTIVSWNAIITACVENLKFGEAIEYFVKMRDCGFEPDEATMVVILSICVELGNLSLGRWVHSQVILRGITLNCQLGTALVDMYAKSGSVGCASLLFDRVAEKNVWTWSAMILGLAQHGFARDALELFAKMMKSLARPNYVTFLGVLCACSHAGLVDDGRKYFYEMGHIHGIKPMMVHYGAMVDTLGRAGRLEEAYNFIVTMLAEPDPIIWRTLLSACSIHQAKDIEGVGEKVRQRLLELEPRRGGNLVMVANMYAEVGMWEQAKRVRSAMRDRGMKKMAGESCIELGGSVHKFFSGSDPQADCEGIHELLDGLNRHMHIVTM